MPEMLTTQVLIDRVQQGDRSALDDLCTRYQQRVLRAVRIRLGAKLRCQLQSSDVVQDVMIKAIEGIDRFEFRTDGAFMKHLNCLVEHRIRDLIDHWQAQRRDPGREIPLGGRSSSNGDPLKDIEAPSGPGPSTLLVLAEDLERMERAMDGLSEEHRELVVAVELEGRSYGELADEGRFGKTPDAIRMKLNRAKARLAQLYHELDGGS
jgi:RNA polymerase sigma-70 factor (subfamily 1)